MVASINAAASSEAFEVVSEEQLPSKPKGHDPKDRTQTRIDCKIHDFEKENGKQAAIFVFCFDPAVGGF